MSRFCIDLYTQSAFNDIKFGDADILARAKGTSVAAIASHNVVYAKAGIVHLLERTEIPETIDKDENCIWFLTQHLTQAMATGGVEACAKAVFTLLDPMQSVRRILHIVCTLLRSRKNGQVKRMPIMHLSSHGLIFRPERQCWRERLLSRLIYLRQV